MSCKIRQTIPKLMMAVLISMLTAGEAGAVATLLNYENRVVRAAEQIERIKVDQDYAEEGISHIKGLLPRSEQIELDQRHVTVDNTWLYALLDSYAAEPDPQQRIAKLNEAAGRLRALDDHLRRANAPPADGGNPREKVREILSRPAYQPEPDTVVGAFVKKVLRRIRALMGEVLMSLRQLLEKILGVGASGGWFSRVVLIALLAAAGFFLVQLLIKMRVPRAKRKKTRVILGEEIAADDTSRELAEAGLEAARAGDFRTAVRKLYVSLLYELAERNLIELEDSATNHEYLRKVSRFNVLASPMHYMTDRFDYVWYGMFPSSEDEFAAYRSRYEEAMHRAKTLAEQSASAV
ncbi:MAG TPA: DUF4129 domain-containing protein [Blastocatellia bacterium]|nr:DUF4129 domain-containing protein [Blastocatellia bacterium]